MLSKRMAQTIGLVPSAMACALEHRGRPIESLSQKTPEGALRQSMERVRLLLLDSHVLLRESLSRVLSAERDLRIVGGYGSVAEGLEVLRHSPVEVVLLGSDVDGEHGYEFMRLAREAGYKGRVLILAAGMDASSSSKALQFGASGIFLQNSSPESLLKAIRLVAGGQVWIDPDVLQQLADGVLQRENQMLRTGLTVREQQVLRGVLEGFTNKNIGSQIGISEGAVKSTLQQLFRKAGVRNRSQLVRVALSGSLHHAP